MNTKLFLLLFLIVSGTNIAAQECNCLKEFAFVQEYMEKNHPGLNSGTKNTKEYKKGVKKLKKEIKKVNPIQACNLYLNEYMLLAKDHHISLGFTMPDIKRFDTKSAAALDSFYNSAAYKSTLRIKLDTTETIARLKNSTEKIEGLYQDGSGNLIAFVKEPGKGWNYKGIAVRTASLIFPVGTVKYEIQERPTGSNWGMILLPDYQRLYAPVTITEEGIPTIGLTRVNEKDKVVDNSGPFAFNMLNDSTAYLRLSSFDGKYYKQLINFYKSIDSQLLKTPYLVIDVRGNGGGSEENYAALKKYIHSGPVRYENIEMWVTPDNIKRYEDAAERKRKGSGFSQSSIERDETIVSMMKAATPNTFLPLGEAHTDTPAVILPYPNKIAILIDRGTASSAEGFIAFARQSKKVITLGENTGGYVGYGDVMTINTTCFNYPLNITSFRTKLYQFEFVGMPPGRRLDAGKDWVKEASLLITSVN